VAQSSHRCIDSSGNNNARVIEEKTMLDGISRWAQVLIPAPLRASITNPLTPTRVVQATAPPTIPQADSRVLINSGYGMTEVSGF